MGRDDVTADQLEALLKKYDRNGDSQIDFGEFLEMFSNFKQKSELARQGTHSKGAASTTGVVGSHTFLHEEVHIIAR